MSDSRVVDVGTPSNDFSGWTTTEVRFHKFAELSTETEECSPKFLSLGHEWGLDLYPGGDDDSDEGYVAIALSNMSDESIKIEWGVSVKDADGKEEVHKKPYTVDLAAYGDNMQTAASVILILLNDQNS